MGYRKFRIKIKFELNKPISILASIKNRKSTCKHSASVNTVAVFSGFLTRDKNKTYLYIPAILTQLPNQKNRKFSSKKNHSHKAKHSLLLRLPRNTVNLRLRQTKQKHVLTLAKTNVKCEETETAATICHNRYGQKLTW